MIAPRPGALSGVVVIDASRVLAGPYAAMLLGDLGATVVKVEDPARGDDTRRWGPPFTADGESAYYLAFNRNKLGVALDLKDAEGRRLFEALLGRADVLIENFKARTREALRLAGEAPRARFPRLVHTAVTGFGATGSFRDRSGYDNIIQAETGLMSLTGEAGGAPQKLGVAISDLATGLHAATATLAALRHRDLTGEGQFVDVSLFDASLGLLGNVASSFLVSGEPPLRWGNAHAAIVPYQLVRAQDGEVMLAVGNDAQFGALAELLGRRDWRSDPRFATNAARVAHRDVLMPWIEAAFRERTVSDWLAALDASGIPAGRVASVPEALSSEVAIERGMVGGDAVGPVPKLSRTPARVDLRPPRLGEHTEEVLRELLGGDG